MTSNPTPARTPYCHKIRYGITGAPILDGDDMDGSHAPGVGVVPTLIELVYIPARDGKPARVDASVTGDWTRFGEPDGFGGQVATHFKDGPDGWPAWLAEEARLHDPAAASSFVVGQTTRDRIADVAKPFFMNFSDEEAAKVNAGELADALAAVLPPPVSRADVYRDAADALERKFEGATRATIELRRMADEAQQPEAEAAVLPAKHREVYDETRPLCACGRFWPCALAEAVPAVGARQPDTEAEVKRLRAELAEEVRKHNNTIAVAAGRTVDAEEARAEAARLRDELRRLADEAQPEPETRPARGDQFETWLKKRRDEYEVRSSPQWHALDEVLDTYRLHADTGTPLDQHACDGPHCDCPNEDAVEHGFGVEDCTCIPFTRQETPPRYLNRPTDTVDMISGWERRSDCPHHAPAAGVRQPDTETPTAALVAELERKADGWRERAFQNSQELSAVLDAIGRVRQLHDRLAEETDLTSPNDPITRGAAAKRIATALDGWNPTGAPQCDVEFEGGGRCAKPAAHRPPGSDDPHVPAVSGRPAADDSGEEARP